MVHIARVAPMRGPSQVCMPRKGATELAVSLSMDGDKAGAMEGGGWL